MIYLDYCATTPVNDEVLDSYIKVTKEYIGNTHSLHKLGVASKKLYDEATKQIADLFNIMQNEVIYTSGATEANNMAIIGYALANHKKGNHIIVSMLEHPSIYKMCEYLETLGFRVSYVKNLENGTIDIDDLRNLITEETILVSVCAVNSEVGVRQPLKAIRQVIKKENMNTIFHSDMTQAIGKCNISLHDVDMATMSGHKIYGPKGIGMLYLNSKIKINPILQGSTKFDEIRPGTVLLPLIVSFSKALRIALTNIDKKESYVKKLNDRVINHFKKYENILVNNTEYSIPFIINISVPNIKSETLVHALEAKDIYISTNTACSSSDLSTSVLAIYGDKKRAVSTLRISLSYLTTSDEITKFLAAFDEEYEKLINLV